MPLPAHEACTILPATVYLPRGIATIFVAAVVVVAAAAVAAAAAAACRCARCRISSCRCTLRDVGCRRG